LNIKIKLKGVDKTSDLKKKQQSYPQKSSLKGL